MCPLSSTTSQPSNFLKEVLDLLFLSLNVGHSKCLEIFWAEISYNLVTWKCLIFKNYYCNACYLPTAMVTQEYFNNEIYYAKPW